MIEHICNHIKTSLWTWFRNPITAFSNRCIFTDSYHFTNLTVIKDNRLLVKSALNILSFETTPYPVSLSRIQSLKHSIHHPRNSPSIQLAPRRVSHIKESEIYAVWITYPHKCPQSSTIPRLNRHRRLARDAQTSLQMLATLASYRRVEYRSKQRAAGTFTHATRVFRRACTFTWESRRAYRVLRAGHASDYTSILLVIIQSKCELMSRVGNAPY